MPHMAKSILSGKRSWISSTMLLLTGKMLIRAMEPANRLVEKVRSSKSAALRLAKRELSITRRVHSNPKSSGMFVSTNQLLLLIST